MMRRAEEPQESKTVGRESSAMKSKNPIGKKKEACCQLAGLLCVKINNCQQSVWPMLEILCFGFTFAAGVHALSLHPLLSLPSLLLSTYGFFTPFSLTVDIHIAPTSVVPPSSYPLLFHQLAISGNILIIQVLPSHMLVTL